MKIGQKIWHCKFLGYDENDLPTYSMPIEYTLSLHYLSINSASGYLDTIRYGENISKMWNMVALKSIFDNEFHEGDVLYIEGNYPNIFNENYVNGDGANARIQSVLPQLVSITCELEKIQP